MCCACARTSTSNLTEIKTVTNTSRASEFLAAFLSAHSLHESPPLSTPHPKGSKSESEPESESSPAPAPISLRFLPNKATLITPFRMPSPLNAQTIWPKSSNNRLVPHCLITHSSMLSGRCVISGQLRRVKLTQLWASTRYHVILLLQKVTYKLLHEIIGSSFLISYRHHQSSLTRYLSLRLAHELSPDKSYSSA